MVTGGNRAAAGLLLIAIKRLVMTGHLKSGMSEWSSLKGLKCGRTHKAFVATPASHFDYMAASLAGLRSTRSSVTAFGVEQRFSH
jgi:hypothetical protein